MAEIDFSSIITSDDHVTVSTQLQPEEQLEVRELIKRLIDEYRDGTLEHLKLKEDWIKLYEAHKEPPKEAPSQLKTRLPEFSKTLTDLASLPHQC